LPSRGALSQRRPSKSGACGRDIGCAKRHRDVRDLDQESVARPFGSGAVRSVVHQQHYRRLSSFGSFGVTQQRCRLRGGLTSICRRSSASLRALRSAGAGRRRAWRWNRSRIRAYSGRDDPRRRAGKSECVIGRTSRPDEPGWLIGLRNSPRKPGGSSGKSAVCLVVAGMRVIPGGSVPRTRVPAAFRSSHPRWHWSFRENRLAASRSRRMPTACCFVGALPSSESS
jgi:hypothetical protein